MWATVENLNKEQFKEESKNDPQAIENAYKLLEWRLTPESQAFQKELFAQDEGIDTLNAVQDGLEKDQNEKMNDLRNQWKIEDSDRAGYDFVAEIDIGGRPGKRRIDFRVIDGILYGSATNSPREGRSFDDLYTFMTAPTDGGLPGWENSQ